MKFWLKHLQNFEEELSPKTGSITFVLVKKKTILECDYGNDDNDDQDDDDWWW